MKLKKELTYDQEEFDYNDKKTWQQRGKDANNNFALLQSIEKKTEKEHPVLGGFFEVSVADGKVFYQVVEVTGRKAIVRRCAGICQDMYEDAILGQEAEIMLSKATELVNRRRVLLKLFGG